METVGSSNQMKIIGTFFDVDRSGKSIAEFSLVEYEGEIFDRVYGKSTYWKRSQSDDLVSQNRQKRMESVFQSIK